MEHSERKTYCSKKVRLTFVIENILDFFPVHAGNKFCMHPYIKNTQPENENDMANSGHHFLQWMLQNWYLVAVWYWTGIREGIELKIHIT
jgi:hypothetical protein